MVADPVLQWALTIAFGATGLYAALRIAMTRAPLILIGQLLHLLMSAGMVAMCWPWWAALPAMPQTVVFGTATVWFAALFALQLARRVRRSAVDGHEAWHQAAHAIMMLAMVWMIVTMGLGGGAAGAAGAVGTTGEADAAGHHHGELPLWAALSGVGLTAGLLVAGAIFAIELLRSLRGRPRWLGHAGDLAAGAVMSFGMAAMCWPMIAS